MPGRMFLVSALCAARMALSAEAVYAPPFELINVHPDYGYATIRLLKNYVDDAGRYTLVTPERNDTAVPAGAPAIRARARELGLPYYLVGDLNRMGETVILNVALHETAGGTRVWGDRLKASSPEDLDPIFQKLARAMGSGRKAAEDGDIFSVTGYDSRELRQVRTKNAFGLGLGGILFTPGLLGGDPWRNPFSGGIGIFWGHDARTLLFQTTLETYGQSMGSDFSAVSISAYKPFTWGSFTPFGGGGVGLGAARTWHEDEETEGGGLFLQGGGGIIFNRTSTVQLRLRASYMLGLFRMEEPRNDFPRAFLTRMELSFVR